MLSGMHTTTAYERRETLDDDDLERLRAALFDEVERYRICIRSYNPEKMRRLGEPYLAKLINRVEEVDGLREQRMNAREPRS